MIFWSIFYGLEKNLESQKLIYQKVKIKVKRVKNLIERIRKKLREPKVNLDCHKKLRQVKINCEIQEKAQRAKN